MISRARGCDTSPELHRAASAKHHPNYALGGVVTFTFTKCSIISAHHKESNCRKSPGLVLETNWIRVVGQNPLQHDA